jgi:glycosyltransferase involved in cell wall biosynthesis
MKNLLLSVVVPAYNEAQTVEAALRRIRAVPLRVEIIVVNDASTDGTREILEGLAQQGLVDHLVHHDRNRGKGAAIRSGAAVATGDAFVVQDADLEYDPAELPGLVQPISSGQGRRRVRLAVSGRPPPRAVLLALCRQPLPHAVVEHVHEPEPVRPRDLL